MTNNTRRMLPLESEFSRSPSKAPSASPPPSSTAVTEYQNVDRAHYLGLPTSLQASFDAVYPSNYHLELYDNWVAGAAPVDAFILPYPNAIQMQAPMAVARTWTMESLYEEHTGFRQKAFLLSGRSGFLAEDLIRFHAFRNFLETYAELSAANKSAFVRLKDVRLVLNFPFEGESYFCTVMGFEYTRDTSTSRMSYVYQLRLLTQGWATRKWRLPSFMSTYLDKPDPNGNHLTPQHNCHHYSRVAELTGTGELPRAPHDRVVALAATGGGTETRATSLPAPGARGAAPPATIKAPKDPAYYADLWWAVEAAIAATAVAYALLSPDRQLAVRYQFVLRNMWYSELKMQAAMYLGVQYEKLDMYASLATTGDDFVAAVGANYGPASFMFSLGTVGKHNHPAQRPRRPRPFPVRPEPVVATTTTAGDTSLINVAARELGNPALWSKLVELNGWQDARTLPNGDHIRPGVSLVLPAPEGTPAPTAGDLYGTDLLLVDGDLYVVGGNDVATISGPANLLQNLEHRMLTDRGTNKTFPSYGLVPRVGTATNQDTLALTLSDVKLQATADHRVANLRKLDVTQTGDRLNINFEVEAITRARVTASFSRPGTV